MEESVGEFEIQFAILEPMKDRKIWSNADLKQKLAKTLSWTDHDRQRSPSRENEYIWENRINNALSPSRKSSLYGKEYVDNAGRGLHRITNHGYLFITDGYDFDDILKCI